MNGFESVASPSHFVMIFREKNFSFYILLTDEISSCDSLCFLRYWRSRLKGFHWSKEVTTFLKFESPTLKQNAEIISRQYWFNSSGHWLWHIICWGMRKKEVTRQRMVLCQLYQNMYSYKNVLDFVVFTKNILGNKNDTQDYEQLLNTYI